MGKLAILIIVLMLGVLALFAVFNYDTTTINVPFGSSYELSKIGLILLSSLFGAITVLVIFFIRDTRRLMFTYQHQRRQKKEDKLHALYSKAMNSILAEDEAGARVSLEEILKVEPGHADALLRVGDIARKRGDHEAAVEHYKKALAANPGNLEALFSLVSALESLDRRAEALKYAEEVLELDPDNLSALFRKRSIVELEGRWDDVIDVQKSILKNLSKEKDVEREKANMLGFRYELARDALEKGELERANKVFRAIVRESEDFIPAFLGVAEVMIAEGDPEASASYLEKAYDTTASEIVLARLEDVLLGMGEPSRLISVYRKALSARPEDEGLKFFLGKLYYRLEMVDDAFEALVNLDPAEDFPDLHRLLGELYLRREQCPEAAAEFKKTLELKKTLRLPYCCSVCWHADPEWSGRCPECGNWNTYVFDRHGVCRV